MTSAGRDRIEGLDAWRAVLMVFGIMYHGVMLRPETPFFTGLILTSNSCRMGLFFAISGLVMARALERHPPAAWLRHRLVSMAVPTLFGLLVICPLTALSFHLVPAPDRPPTAFPQWYHVWFLVALILYTPIGYAMHRLDERRELIVRMATDPLLIRHAQAMMLVVVPLISFTLMQAVMMMVTHLAPPTMWYPLIQLRPTAGYLPVFLLGFVMGRSERLRLAVTERLWTPVLILASIALAYLAWHLILADLVLPGNRSWMRAVMLVAGSALCPPALLVLVVRSAFAIRTVPAPARRLAGASFTIYLVHFPIEMTLNGLFTRVAGNEYAEWVASVLATLVMSYAVHAMLVRRSPVAALLLNGVLPRRRRLGAATHAASLPIAPVPEQA